MLTGYYKEKPQKKACERCQNLSEERKASIYS